MTSRDQIYLFSWNSNVAWSRDLGLHSVLHHPILLDKRVLAYNFTKRLL